MKVAEIKLPDEWEPGKCEICPYFHYHITDRHCILGSKPRECPVKAKEVEDGRN